jgi:hypothetical protein
LTAPTHLTATASERLPTAGSRSWGLLAALLRLPGTAAELALRVGVAPSGVPLPAVHHVAMDTQQVHDSGFDPADYVWPPMVAALLNDDSTGGGPLYVPRHGDQRPARDPRRDCTPDSVISVQPDTVAGTYEEARELCDEIVHPITTELWGVRRFLVRASDGSVINVVRHRD